MKRLFFAAVISLLCLGMAAKSGYKPRVEGLSAEGQAMPRFSWRIVSTAPDVVQESYRIIVSSSRRNLRKGVGDIWDSGVVESPESRFIPYVGLPLESRTKALWRVISYTNSGVAKSRPSCLEVALNDAADWQARWIGLTHPGDSLNGKSRFPARYLRKEFRLGRRVRSARLFICGLGLYEAWLNGREVAPDQVLSPTLADYNKHVYYNSFDVTPLLRRGGNALAVAVGSGRYVSLRNPGKPFNIPDIRHYGSPVLLCQLEVTYRNGRTEVFVSDTSWQATCDGPILANNEFDGEIYDANRELGAWTRAGYDGQWAAAEELPAPKGALAAQPNPNIAIQDIVRPVSVTEKDGGRYIIDMGQNMVGWAEISATGLRNVPVMMRFAETLTGDGELYTANLRSAEVRDLYIPARNGRFTWEPTFVYHGFRYVEVVGTQDVPQLVGKVFYDRMATTGHFSCSNEVMNQVYRNAFWGIRGNYRGMPTDCPQRDERMGWLGDRTTGCYGESYLFDNRRLYAKWLQDIADSQEPSGSLPNVVPRFYDILGDNMTWPAVFLTAADMLYTHFGDAQPIRDHYPQMKRWLAHMKEHYDRDGILEKDIFGDWCMPPESLELIHSKDPSRITSGPLMATAFYSWMCRLMARFAGIVGQEEDIPFYENEVRLTNAAFNREYWHEEEGYYGNNTVTANLLALWHGIAPEAVRDRVFAHIVEKTEKEWDGHVSCGVIGIQQLMRVLTEYGRPDLALKIASSDTYPSWGYMARNGATTIWELWNGNTADPSMNSGNHVMILGDLLTWEYAYLAGIRAAAPGFRRIELRPLPIPGLDWVKCSFESGYGTIESNWKKEGGQFIWEITLPANTTATVYLPGQDRPLEKGSGTHRFIVD